VQLPNAWRGKNRPCTPAEEACFHSDLLDIALKSDAAPSTAWSRGDLTVLAAALRSGATAGEVVAVAPGLNIWALLGAYSAVEHARSEAAAAWYRVVDLKATASEADLAAAAVLIPAAVRTVRDAYTLTTSTSLEVRTQERLYVVSIWATVDRVFSQLAAVDSSDDHGTVSLARQLYYPEADCLYVNAHFLPRRVGELSPHRISALCAHAGLLDANEDENTSRSVDDDIHTELHSRKTTPSEPRN
jgi:hypothetical protein